MAYPEAEHELVPPRRPNQDGFYSHSPRNSEYEAPHTSDYNGSSTNLVRDTNSPMGTPQTPYRDYPAGSKEHITTADPNPYGYGNYTPGVAQKKKSRRKWFIIGGLILLVAIAAAVIIPVYFKVIKKDDDETPSGGSNTGNNGGTTGTAVKVPVTGGDGSNITLADGKVVRYNNTWGGTWYFDPENPFANNAQAQSDTPPLNTSWRFGVDPIRGVNLGGWFVLEPFISPALFQKYNGPNDEWALSEAMRADAAGGGIDQIEEHYKTFIVSISFGSIFFLSSPPFRLKKISSALPPQVSTGFVSPSPTGQSTSGPASLSLSASAGSIFSKLSPGPANMVSESSSICTLSLARRTATTTQERADRLTSSTVPWVLRMRRGC
jgi:hypothetical protein